MRNFSSWRLLGPMLSKGHQHGPSTLKRRTLSSICLSTAIAMGLLAGTSSSATAAPSITINDVSVTEGNSGVQTATFTVYLSASSATNVSVKYETVNGTATAGTDYNALAQSTLVFAPGQTSKAVNVTVKGDVIDEADETFSLKLSAPVGATIGDATGVGKILDNDTSVISATGASVLEGNSGTTPLNFTLKLSTPNSRAVTVKAKTQTAATSPATVGTDYTGLVTTTYTFAPGETSKVIPISVKGDTLDEDSKEYIGFALATPVNAELGTVGEGIIVDDDDTPTLSVGDVTVTEGNTGELLATFLVSLSAPSGKPITVQYSTSNGTATVADYDYSALEPTTLTFAPGQTVRAVNVEVIGDTTDEEDENFYLKLASPVNASIADNLGVGTIIDNDTSVLSVTGSTVTEGNSGVVAMNFTLTLSRPNSRVVQVQAQAVAASPRPATAGADFQQKPPTVYSFAIGQTSKVVPVTILADVLDEYDENLKLALSTPVNATIGATNTVGTITDDDATPSVRINDVSVQQVFSGTRQAVLQVTLSAPSGRNVVVNYMTSDGTATANEDYVPEDSDFNEFENPPITFAPGETSKNLGVTVLAEASPETADGDENFYVFLGVVTNATIADNEGLVTILDNINEAPDATDVFKDAGNLAPGQRTNFSVDVSQLGVDPDGDPLYITDAVIDSEGSVNGGTGVVSIVNNQINFRSAPTTTQDTYQVKIDFTISDGIDQDSGSLYITYHVGPGPSQAVIRQSSPTPSGNSS